jgi:phytoene synthase
LADSVGRFHIPAEHLLAVLDGVQMDLDDRRYQTFDELAEYCRRVASAVGMACLHIWGFRGDGALEPADRCGLAFQLTNILRDLREDIQRGRVYLPQEELRQCDYSEQDLAAAVADARFHRLMQLQFDRAEQFYREATALFDWLDSDGQRIFGMMMTIYYRLLREIRKQPAAVLSRRVALGRLRKTRITARWFLLPPKHLLLS